jgi:hypothetical protein
MATYELRNHEIGYIDLDKAGGLVLIIGSRRIFEG